MIGTMAPNDHARGVEITNLFLIEIEFLGDCRLLTKLLFEQYIENRATILVGDPVIERSLEGRGGVVIDLIPVCRLTKFGALRISQHLICHVALQPLHSHLTSEPSEDQVDTMD